MTKFRLQALAHLGEPEELDIAPRLVDPRAWIAVIALLAAVIAAVVWSFVARVPRTVTAQGVLTPAGGLLTVQSSATGVIGEVLIRPGQPVTAGGRVATVIDPGGTAHTVTSPFAGRVVAVAARTGQPITAGSSLVSLEPGSATTLVAQLFVASSSAASIAPGMHVLMSVESAPSAAFGLLEGDVQTIAAQTVTPDQATALLGNAVLVRTLTRSAPQRLVTVALKVANTRSGYRWTGAGGPPFPLPAQTLLSGTVQIGSQKPIDFVFGH